MKKYSIDIKWGFIFIAVTLLWMLLERLLGFHNQHIDKHAIVTNFFFLPAIAVYIYGLLDKRRNFYDGEMTYLQGLYAGLIITIVVSIFAPLTQYITSKIISPDYFTNVIKYSIESGKMTQIQAEQYFNLKSYITQTTIFTPIMGIATSVVVAIFTRGKKKG